MIDFSRNHFALFDLPERFAIDVPALDAAYRRLQAEIHPDRHAGDADAERRLAAQSSARLNEAYGALKTPLTRAQYLLALHAVDAVDERDTRLDLDFLERQLARREAADAANAVVDVEALEALHAEALAEVRDLEAMLTRDLDRDGADFAGAKPRVRELAFLVRLADSLDAMIAAHD
ncbi:MAG: Fe-S protein assembly co-chaperone HscB [Burkholderiales bacterium]|nr:Fe-S protein assembly co-chaperone HscB [Burkholderiales bacterium]